ncbi:MAG: hypothetical protein ACREP2_14105 [Rhodanobacteraceae bacterium]
MSSKPQNTVTSEIETSERSVIHHELAIERARASRCRDALARASDGRLRSRWRRKLDAIFGRAATLALALVDMGEAVPVARVWTEFDGRMLDAMDGILRKHPRPVMVRVVHDHAGRSFAAHARRRFP